MSTIRSQHSNITLLLPPGAAISNYDLTALPEDQQTASSLSGDGNVSAVGHTATSNGKGAHSVPPQAFIDAMKVRKVVFVDEQNVPLENEVDEEDEHSFHWVAYGSLVENGTDSNQEKGGGGDTGTVPAGTLRLVPPLTTSLHDHTEEANSNTDPSSATNVHTAIQIEPSLDNTNNTSPESEFPTSPSAIAALPTSHSRPTAFPASEPYARLSRLAITPPFRRRGLARQLVDEALEWSRMNPEVVARRIASGSGGGSGGGIAGADGSSAGAGAGAVKWNGLVVIHAQTHASAVQFWEKVGFRRDAGMGVWNEEGIVHVGMWMRLKLDEE